MPMDSIQKLSSPPLETLQRGLTAHRRGEDGRVASEVCQVLWRGRRCVGVWGGLKRRIFLGTWRVD